MAKRKIDWKRLKVEVMELGGYPELKVKQWMPILLKHRNTKEWVMHDDPDYRKVHYFCKNAKARRDKLRAINQQANDADQAWGGQH